jgi:hypothetical protein
MRVGRGIARVEIPRWVAENPGMVALVHTLIYDQCMKGQGYPVALARAHEQALMLLARHTERIETSIGSLRGGSWNTRHYTRLKPC